MENPYRPPGSMQPDYAAHADAGTIDAAVNGEYDFDIGEVIREAWDKSDGAKGTLWAALIIAAVISGIGSAILKRVVGTTLGDQAISALLLLPITAPLFMGWVMMAVRRAADLPIEASDVFRFFNPYNFNIVIARLLVFVAVFFGFVLLVIPGLYLSVALSFATLLVADKGLPPMEALTISRQAVHHKWGKLFTFCLVLFLIGLAGLLALGIGLIWALPTIMIANGIVYRKIFGVTPDSAR